MSKNKVPYRRFLIIFVFLQCLFFALTSLFGFSFSIEMEEYLEAQTLGTLDYHAKEKVEARLRENFILLQELSPLVYEESARDKKKILYQILKDRGVQKLMRWTDKGEIQTYIESPGAPKVSFMKEALEDKSPYFFQRIDNQLYSFVKAQIYGTDGIQFIISMNHVDIDGELSPLFGLTQSQFAFFSLGSEKSLLQNSLSLSGKHFFNDWLKKSKGPPNTDQLETLYLGSNIFRSIYAKVGASPDQSEDYYIVTLNESAANYKPLKIYRGRLVLIFLFTAILSMFFGFTFLNDQKIKKEAT